MKPSFSFLCLTCLIFLSLFVSSASAVVISFSDMGIEQNQKILIYAPYADYNETFIGEYNTTATVILDEDNHYVMVFKPDTWDTLNDPLNAIELFKASVPVGLSVALFVFAILGGFILLARAFRK
ncbi:hypothetical protein [Methanoplanus endosymbiosus]|uniref:Uncharacterized protein n=1 Tax=Methanoplanus endosymbiosus TaxID=33865 RepID=A0A9E7PND8_9EURY|nr:hypothetical protein [Methanoplanus endosymbiosus]UUX92081.1 hypothetical protein L6E24_12060 [Methanoplanus endosymbiosus]